MYKTRKKNEKLKKGKKADTVWYARMLNIKHEKKQNGNKRTIFCFFFEISALLSLIDIYTQNIVCQLMEIYKPKRKWTTSERRNRDEKSIICDIKHNNK